MIKESITIINKLGLHARAAAKLSALAGSFKSQIQIEKKRPLCRLQKYHGRHDVSRQQGDGSSSSYRWRR